jgi:hypothetical protein
MVSYDTILKIFECDCAQYVKYLRSTDKDCLHMEEIRKLEPDLFKTK